ncbi:MAG: hypothetical protein WCK58_14535, partial [Chloroflexota bacterium]
VLVAGTVRCWGANAHGQLGNGTTTGSLTPVAVSGITNAIGIAAGGYHTCALLAAGSLRCWGSGWGGQLGNGAIDDSLTPVAVSGITTATAVTAGDYHACALLDDATIRCWGHNGAGQLGDGTTTGRSVPVAVSGITAAAVAAGAAHTCALVASGSVTCWGLNDIGQLGDGTAITRSVPAEVSGITTGTTLAAGGDRGCVVLVNGTIRCWGSNAGGGAGDGTSLVSVQPAGVTGIGALGASTPDDGTHQVCVRASNAAGATSNDTTCASLLVNLGPPVAATPLVSPALVTEAGTTVALTAGITDAGAVVSAQYRIDAGAWTSLSPFDGAWGGTDEGGQVLLLPSVVGALVDGTHQVCVRATDAEGHTSGGAACTTLVVDMGSPVISTPIVTPSAVTSGGTPVAVGATASDGTSVAGAQLRIDAGSWSAMSAFDGAWGGATERALAVIPAVTVAALADGTHTICVRAADSAGRTSDGTACSTLAVELAAPSVVSFTTASASPTNAGSTDYTLVLSEAVIGLESLDFENAGTATGCTFIPSDFSGTSFTVTILGCTGGTLQPRLAALTVTDLADKVGPADPVTGSLVVLDCDAPVFATAASVAVRAGVVLPAASATTALPVTVSWTATGSSDSPVASYALERKSGSGAWMPVVLANPLATSLVTTVPPTGTVTFRVTAADGAGNTAVSETTALTPRLVQQTSPVVKVTGTWTTATGAALSGGSARWARTAGASAVFTFTGRAIGLVATRSAAAGSVRIYVDGVYRATANLYRATTQARYLAWAATWASSGPHTVRLVVVGTAAHPRVEIDAFITVQ